MSEGRRFYWAIAERIIDDEEIGRIAIVAENEVSAFESGRWALIERLGSCYRSAVFLRESRLRLLFQTGVELRQRGHR